MLNMIRIASRSGGGAGTYLLLACDMFGEALLHAAYLPLGKPGRHGGFVIGMAGGLACWAGRAVRRCLCGC